MQPMHDSIPEERDPHNEFLLGQLGRIYGYPGEKPAIEHVQEQAIARTLEQLLASRAETQLALLQATVPRQNEQQAERNADDEKSMLATSLLNEGTRRPVRRSRRMGESGLAIMLVASLLVAWLVVIRLPHSQGALPEQKPLFTYIAQPGENIFSRQWTPDDKYLTFVLYKGTTDIGPQQYRLLTWNRETGKLRQVFSFSQNDDKNHSLGVGVSPDGRYAFIDVRIGRTQTMKVGNLITGQFDLVTTSFSTEPQFSPSSKRLAYIGGDKRIHIWDLQTRKPALTGDPIDVRSGMELLSWLPDEKALVVESSSSGSQWDSLVVQLWNPVTGHRVRSIASTANMRIIPEQPGEELSPDGQRLLTYDNNAGKIQVRDTMTLHVISTFAGPLMKENLTSSMFQAITWIDDGKRLFGLSPENNSWRVWDPTTGRVVLNLPIKQPGAFVTAPTKGRLMAFAQQGKKLIEVWDVITGKRISTIQFDISQRGFSLEGGSSDSRYRIIESGSATYLFDVYSGKRIATYQGGDFSWLSDDGKYIVIEKYGKASTVEVMKVA